MIGNDFVHSHSKLLWRPIMRKINLILSIIMLIVSGVFYIMIAQLPKEASLYPILVTTILLVLSLILLIKSYFQKEDEELTAFKNIKIKQLLFVLVVNGVYVFLINLIGYVVSTALYILVALIGLKVDRKKSFLISSGVCLFVYVLFKVLLKVPLPKGFII